ncbi:hypothetical protein GCM10011368_02790 [Hyunsoonleella pacifica]|nr:hypothetical protein GCM10011368_02790 [Hyunsoonleella pacifica]
MNPSALAIQEKRGCSLSMADGFSFELTVCFSKDIGFSEVEVLSQELQKIAKNISGMNTCLFIIITMVSIKLFLNLASY